MWTERLGALGLGDCLGGTPRLTEHRADIPPNRRPGLVLKTAAQAIKIHLYSLSI